MMRRLRLSKLPPLSRPLEKKEKRKLSEVAILKEILTHSDFLREIEMNEEFTM